MGLFDRRAPKAALAPPEGSTERALLEAARQADMAASALSVALVAHRVARTRLSGETALRGKGAVNRLWSQATALAALAAHGLESHFGFTHVARAHRRTFEQSTAAAIAASAAFRPDPEPAGNTGDQQRELAHAQP